MELGDLALFSFGMSLLRYFAAVLAVILVIRWLMWVNKSHSWSTVREKIDADPLSASIYYGLRIVGLFWLAGQILS